MGKGKKTALMTVRISPDVKERFERMSEATGFLKNDLHKAALMGFALDEAVRVKSLQFILDPLMSQMARMESAPVMSEQETAMLCRLVNKRNDALAKAEEAAKAYQAALKAEQEAKAVIANRHYGIGLPPDKQAEKAKEAAAGQQQGQRLVATQKGLQ